MSAPVSGSHDPALLGEQLVRQPHDVYPSLREQPPFRVRFADGEEGWLVTRYSDVKVVAADPRISRDLTGVMELGGESAASTAARSDDGGVTGDAGDDPHGGYDWIYRNVLYLDPPDHTRLRKLVNKAFTPRAIEALRPRIEQIADHLLDQMDAQQDAGDAVDLLASFAVPLPVTAISELLGIPVSDRPDFWAWSHVLNGNGTAADLQGTLRAAADYLGELADSKQAEPGDDLISHMVVASEDGDRLSREELISMSLLILVAGHDTTVNLITNGVLAFLRSPDQLAVLQADPSLLPNAVEEVLRYDCPVNISSGRFTREPIELGGIQIPAGEMLYPSMLAANRDPLRFTAPDRFDISRDVGGHVGFGHGIHFCLGAPLARLEGCIALGKLFGRFPAIRLAAEPGALTYRDSTLIHGLASMPVRLN
jgi:cytochrome P450